MLFYHIPDFHKFTGLILILAFEIVLYVILVQVGYLLVLGNV